MSGVPAAATEAQTLRAALHGAVTRWTAFGKTERVRESDAAAAFGNAPRKPPPFAAPPPPTSEAPPPSILQRAAAQS